VGGPPVTASYGSSGSTGNAGLRVSDAERQATAEQLKAHLAAGRLDMEEYEERLPTALSARTRRDLDELVRDLPATTGPAPSQSPRSRLPFLTVLIGVALFTALMTLGPAHGVLFPWWALPAGFFLLSCHWRRRWYPGYARWAKQG